MSVRDLLKKAYHGLPVSKDLKARLKAAMPYALKQPNPSLRQFGTVQEIYAWRIDGELDTRAYVQNFFSVFYPELDTSTTVKLHAFDEEGRPLAQRVERLAARQTLAVSIREWLGKNPAGPRRGTLMWHVVLPPAVAARPECAEHHAYFTDRGYIAFVQAGEQASYMHGIDRYAVFQKADSERFDPFYRPGKTYEWRPEIPLGAALGCASLDVVTVNRCAAPMRVTLEVLRADKSVAATFAKTVPERGLFLQNLDGGLLGSLEGGSLRATGLPTPWTRVMIMRHYPGGAVAAMHC